MTVTNPRAIPIGRITDELDSEDALSAVSLALQELCVAQALVMIHGQSHGAEVYKMHGGHVRFNEKGEPVILWCDELAARLRERDREAG